MTQPARRRTGGLLAALLLAFAVVLATAAPASAHAAVRATTPFDGERVEVAEVPDAVTIEFNELVEVPPGGIRVFDADGARVDVDGEVPAAAAPDVAGRALGPLDDGAYIVTWRAVSEDGHPIRGAFVFTVGDAAAADDSLVASLFGGDAGAVTLLQQLVVAGSYALVLFLVGGLLTASTLGEGATSRSAAWFRRAAWGGVALAVLAVPLQAIAVSGDGLAALAGEQLGATLTSSVGLAAVVRAVALVGAALLAGRARTGAAVVALLSFLLDGHTRTVEPLWLMNVADTVHLLAGAVWFGGLVVLVRELRGRSLAADPVGGARMLAGWSRLAVWAVAGVVVAGMGLSFATVRAPLALVTTTYGQLLQAKLVLALLVIALGAWNQRRLVPAVAAAVQPVPAGGADEADGSEPDGAPATAPVAARTELAWLKLRRTVRAEVLLLVVLLAVTGVLQGQRPAAEAVGIGGIFQATLPLVEGVDIDIVVDPNVAGENSIHVYLLDDTGRPFSDIEGLSMQLSLPEQDIGPIERTPVVSGPGHWVLVGRELALPGTWQIDVSVRLDRFTEAPATVQAVVGAP